MKNKFIVIEGIDGVGKSTITTELAKKLNNLDIPSIAVKSPVGDYKLSVDYINSKCDVNSHYLFYISGIKHTSDIIRTLLRDFTVICDRYIYSTEAYHKANHDLSVYVDLTTLDILEPDYKFYIRVSDELVRQKRILERKKVDRGDLEAKHPRGLVDRIEKEFEKHNLTVIDNTSRVLDEVLSEILGIIFDE